MANPLNFQVATFSGSVENTEFNFRNLYLHHIYSGPNRNRANIIAKDGATGLGVTAVNNWSIYDGTGPEASLVARAQGLHIYAGSWHNSVSIVFEVEMFKGSTLQVMGASTEKEGDWAIVDGTGELALARGVVNRKVHEKLDNGEILELTIHGYCKTSVVLGPSEFVKEVWGTNGKYNGETVIASIKFITNENVYGPFGNEQGPASGAKAPDFQSILGFFGTSTQTYVQGIGVCAA